MHRQPETTLYGSGVNEAYRPLPSLYLTLSSIWFVSSWCWAFITWRNRHSQTNNLQWTLASVPVIKTLQLLLSFLFWYSCFYSKICSLWMSFGVYVTGVFFQTASFVSFLLISHGYCIMSEHLSARERRVTAALGCIFYLTLVGYRASIPYFTALLLLNYFISFSVIFRHISQNLLVLREQLSVIEDEDIRVMHDAINSKYIMFKKFRIAMQLVALAEAAIYINIDISSDTYWIRLLVREWVQFCIFLYIGWTFRAQELAPRFSVMPTVKSKAAMTVPPIYSIEMDAADFKHFCNHEWHIGVCHANILGLWFTHHIALGRLYNFSYIVPSSLSHRKSSSDSDSVLVIVQHPNSFKHTTGDVIPSTPTPLFSPGS